MRAHHQLHPRKTITGINCLNTKRKPSILSILQTLKQQPQQPQPQSQSQSQSQSPQLPYAQPSTQPQNSPAQHLTLQDNHQIEQQICELQASISSFKKCLNDDVKFRECISRESLGKEELEEEYVTMPDRRNPTIQEENEQAEDTRPDEQELDLFYSFLSHKYLTATDKLSYFQLIFKMQQLYNTKLPLKPPPKIPFQPAFLCHFTNLWLESMGFSDPSQQHRIISSIQSFSKDDLSRQAIEAAIGNLFTDFLVPRLHLMLVMNVCRYGWQYLIFFAGRFFSYVKNQVRGGGNGEHQGRIEGFIRQV